MQKHFLILLGTRPEAIKLFPVINRLKAENNSTVTVCATAQHRQLLDQVLKLAHIVPDFDLDVMTANQTLDHLSAGRLTLGVGLGSDRSGEIERFGTAGPYPWLYLGASKGAGPYRSPYLGATYGRGPYPYLGAM